MALGADFYGDDLVVPGIDHPTYQPSFSNASCYPRFLELLRSYLSEGIVDKIAYKNAQNAFI
ncbi:hypothetical protein [Candidatus Neptunochlamydia vexilliferae]|uniref:hypothetical protein n=1 Tax=Candidatus Neptunichlamydia vexilliferae TaxID=1651774 RepID=UPI001890F2B4|nr:hypothetical protein [Candidatus Neptunochlamydia vexilliferae]